MKKIYVEVTSKIVIETNRDDDPENIMSDVISEMDYDFQFDDEEGTKIIDTEVEDSYVRTSDQ